MTIAATAEQIAGGRFRVLIVGAGIAGLTLAALLERWEVRPAIVEHAKEGRAAGYNLGLYPVGSRVLHGLGLYRRFAQATPAAQIPAVQRRRAADAGSGSGRAFRALRADLRHSPRRIDRPAGEPRCCRAGRLRGDDPRGGAGGLRSQGYLQRRLGREQLMHFYAPDRALKDIVKVMDGIV